jgi:hypothetical protein
MPLSVRRTYPTTITIDDQPIRLLITRMNMAQWTAFSANFYQFGAPPRGSADDSLEAIAARRIDSDKFAIETLSAYVAIEPECIRDDDRDEWLTTGAAFVEAFGARPDVHQPGDDRSVHAEPHAGGGKKNLVVAARFTSFLEVPPTDGGKRPEPTAPSAEPSNTAATEAATA